MTDLNFMALAREVQQRTGQSRSEAQASVRSVLDAIGHALVAGHRVKLNNFGSFEVRTRNYPARELGPNSFPGGETKVVKFTATGALKGCLDDGGVFNGIGRTYED